ncbi:MAG TPA: YiiX/YebB-like N1pC/P60 family cysteine hydrolase [Thermoanaerobaculia bacterium]|nr:YiiX/YebB-like N1pC/P60 family cysteine hydrolase [Thermoanaerobaculia bacterium]
MTFSLRSSVTRAARAVGLGVLLASLSSDAAGGPEGADAVPGVGAAILAAGPRPGDVVFRRGCGLVSRVVLSSDPASTFSHVGIVVAGPGGLTVVHALPPTDASGGGVVAEPLSEFLAPRAATAAALFRLRGRDARIGRRVAREALRLAEAGVPFDVRFDLATGDALYCTELVWRAYETAGVDLVAGELDAGSGRLRASSYLLPSQLEQSPHLQLIRRAEPGEV